MAPDKFSCYRCDLFRDGQWFREHEGEGNTSVRQTHHIFREGFVFGMPLTAEKDLYASH